MIINSSVNIHTATAIAEYPINLKKPKALVLLISFKLVFYLLSEL